MIGFVKTNNLAHLWKVRLALKRRNPKGKAL